MKLEYKTIEIKDIDNKGHFTGVASPYDNVDLGGDRVRKSISKSNANKTVPYLWGHDTHEPIGKVTLISANNGMNIDGQLFLDKSDDGIPLIPNAFKAYISMKNKLLSNSIGYSVPDKGCKYVTEGSQTIRELLDIDIMEVSGVLFPMNPKAKISDVKSNGGGSMALPIADKKVKWDGSAAAKRVFDKCTDKEGNIDAEAQKAFFYVDTSKSNEKGSYKFGFADIIDDKLTAIPAGIQAAANAIRGARTPSDLPLDTKKSIAKKINPYLKTLKYEEIKDDEIKEFSENIETKDNNQMEEKALGFADLLKIQNANDMRWKLQDALNGSFRQLMNDDTMAIEDKLKQLDKNVDDFATAYKEAMKLVLQASDNNKTAKKQIDEVFEVKQMEIETKAGKKISKANKDKIKRCKDSMGDLMSLLQEMLGGDISNDSDSDDPDDDKSKKVPNEQGKSNDDKLELKSEEIEELKKINALFEGGNDNE